MLRILVCGDRHWRDDVAVFEVLERFVDVKDVMVIDGEANGADTSAHKAAKELGFKTKRFAARWNTYGKAAGPIRNQRMLEEKPHLVFAFHEHIEESKGTRHMMRIAVEAGVPTFLYPQKKPK